MLHDGAVVVGAQVVAGACVVTGALVVVVTRTVVGDGLEDWVSVAQPAMRRDITNGVAQRFMSPVFQTRYETNRGPVARIYTLGLRCRPNPLRGGGVLVLDRQASNTRPLTRSTGLHPIGARKPCTGLDNTEGHPTAKHVETPALPRLCRLVPTRRGSVHRAELLLRCALRTHRPKRTKRI